MKLDRHNLYPFYENGKESGPDDNPCCSLGAAGAETLRPELVRGWPLFKASGIRCHYKHFPGFEFFRSQAESTSASGLVTLTVDIPYSNIYNESTQKWKDSAPDIRKFFH